MRLFLHVGAGKCGSTTIQSFLVENSDRLACQGYGQLQSWGAGNANRLAMLAGTPRYRDYWIKRRHVPESEFVDLERRLSQQTARETESLTDRDQIVLASSEHLYAQCSNSQSVLKLKEFLARWFSEITILFYCRPQDELAKSRWAQRVKGVRRSRETYAEFVEGLGPGDRRFNFHKGLSPWADTFGDEVIRSRILHPLSLDGGTLLADYMSAVGLPASVGSELTGLGTRENVSPSYGSLRLMRRFNLLWPYVPIPRRLANRIGQNPLMERPLGRDFPTALDSQVLDHYRKSNGRFNARFLPESRVGLPALTENRRY